MKLGFNASVNEIGSITSEDFETTSKPPAKRPEADQRSDRTQQSDPVNQPTPSRPVKQLNPADLQSEATEPDQMLLNLETTSELATNETTLNQDERKLSLILGVAAVAFLASFFR